MQRKGLEIASKDAVFKKLAENEPSPNIPKPQKFEIPHTDLGEKKRKDEMEIVRNAGKRNLKDVRHTMITPKVEVISPKEDKSKKDVLTLFE